MSAGLVFALACALIAIAVSVGACSAASPEVPLVE